MPSSFLVEFWVVFTVIASIELKGHGTRSAKVAGTQGHMLLPSSNYSCSLDQTQIAVDPPSNLPNTTHSNSDLLCTTSIKHLFLKKSTSKEPKSMEPISCVMYTRMKTSFLLFNFLPCHRGRDNENMQMEDRREAELQTVNLDNRKNKRGSVE